MRIMRCAALFTAIAAASASGQQVLIDVRTPPPRPAPVQAALGTSVRPDGATLTVNSESLLLNGKPWLPVMGEFHFSRYPEQQWEPELLKMKAAGVQIVSTYIIWIHHEEVEGQWDWSGQRDLRRFVELCAKHGLYVFIRIGPWAHAEARNGGLPDWVVAAGHARSDNPAYLSRVRTFDEQIDAQVKGLLWKDGGPIVGVQIENEYHGPADHIRTLKQMAVQAGLDVPLYTVTGWDGAAIPLDAALPVFGGYADAPWNRSSGQLPPSDVYAFRFHNRSAGALQAAGSPKQGPASTYRGTPFLTAEVGSGIEDTYFRRPVLQPDDVASMASVMVGSGANMLGYYMFHGGRNPDGKLTTLEESQRTGYPTDVPVKSYDFQTPIGEFGQERESLKRLKLINYFLNDFGSQLASMAVYAPRTTPDSPADFSMPRVAVRASGRHAYIFFNNYVRGFTMPQRRGFQVALKLTEKTVLVPAKPIDLPSGTYGVWPVNLDLPGATLLYSTAQLFKHLRLGGDEYYFFFRIPGVAPEFALSPSASARIATQMSQQLLHEVTFVRPDKKAAIQQLTISAGDKRTHLILMQRGAAEDLSNVDGTNALVLTNAQFSSDKGRVSLGSVNDPDFTFATLGANTPEDASIALETGPQELFHSYSAHLPPVSLSASITQLRQAAPMRSPQHAPVPFAPEQADFAHAAAWNIALPDWSGNLAGVLLKLDYRGDVARLSAANHLLDDNFFNGSPWVLGLDGLGIKPGELLNLQVLPFRPHESVVLGQDIPLPTGATLMDVSLVPEYGLTFSLATH